LGLKTQTNRSDRGFVNPKRIELAIEDRRTDGRSVHIGAHKSQRQNTIWLLITHSNEWVRYYLFNVVYDTAR
jgi:hypothetical protein